MRWRAVPTVECAWAQWGDEFVLYHRPSGQTHFINSLTARLLADLQQQPRDTGEVVREFGGEPSHMVGLIRRLAELGLIGRADGPDGR